MKAYKYEDKYYILTDDEMVEVTKEVYDVINRSDEKTRRDARRDGKCAQSDFRKCPHDCSGCPYHTEGYTMLSYTKAFNNQCDEEMDPLESIMDPAACMESIIEDKLYLEQLLKELANAEKQVPHGTEIIAKLLEGKSVRKLSEELGYSRETMRYWIKKLKEFVKAFDKN